MFTNGGWNMRLLWWLLALVVTLVSMPVAPARSASLAPELQKALDSSKYVYIQSTRKDGKLSKAAEIWFMYHNGAVWVASPPSTYRVKRIKAGQTKAKIAVGKTDGPSFNAKGSIVKDPEVNKVLFETYAKKYANEWKSHEQNFRDGLANGSRVLIKYEPAD
jgi:hypothetical protein